MVIDMKKCDCINITSICPGSTECFGVKLAYFPLVRPSNILDVDQVIVSVCNRCICFTSLFGKSTRKLYFVDGGVEEESDDEEIAIDVAHTETGNKCLVFEIYK